MRENGYFLVADMLGFSSVVNRKPEIFVDQRMNDWVELVEELSVSHAIASQLFSDTVFAKAEQTPDGFRRLLTYSRALLEKCLDRSILVRGGIAQGEFHWGKSIYGAAVISAYKLEQNQDWVGIGCPSAVERVDQEATAKNLVYYPLPRKQGAMELSAAVYWNVPPGDRLKAVFVSNLKDGDQLTREVCVKMNNTLQFRSYIRVIEVRGLWATANPFYDINRHRLRGGFRPSTTHKLSLYALYASACKSFSSRSCPILSATVGLEVFSQKLNCAEANSTCSAEKMPLKEEHELAVVRNALNALSVVYTALRSGTPGVEPDCMINVGDYVVGIEHTTAYYTPAAARATWSAARDAQQGKALPFYSSGPLYEFDQSLFEAVHRCILKKAKKSYSGIDRLVLLVHLDSMLTEDVFVEMMVSSIRTTSDLTSFSEVWIGRYQNHGPYRVWKV